jgi:hypothetical protein
MVLYTILPYVRLHQKFVGRQQQTTLLTNRHGSSNELCCVRERNSTHDPYPFSHFYSLDKSLLYPLKIQTATGNGCCWSVETHCTLAQWKRNNVRFRVARSLARSLTHGLELYGCRHCTRESIVYRKATTTSLSVFCCFCCQQGASKECVPHKTYIRGIRRISYM